MPSDEFTSWMAYYDLLDRAKAKAANPDEQDDDDEDGE